MGSSGKIYICATPIGNLDDVSKRLINTLSNVDIVYAEDTRVTSKLLSKFNINVRLKRLDENTISKNLNKIIDIVLEGSNIAYCSDAGMPGVSDPGIRIVEAARNANIELEVIPGPSAALNAYVASGFNKPNFYFQGFLPKKKNQKIDKLKKLSNLDAAIIIYESPNRLLDTLTDIAEVFHDAPVAVCRELTKAHEEVVVSDAQSLFIKFNERDSIKGEIVIVIKSDFENEKTENTNIINLINYLQSIGLSTKNIAASASIVSHLTKKEIYNLIINK